MTFGAGALAMARDGDGGCEAFGFFDKLSLRARMEAPRSGDGDILFGRHGCEDDVQVDTAEPEGQW